MSNEQKEVEKKWNTFIFLGGKIFCFDDFFRNRMWYMCNVVIFPTFCVKVNRIEVALYSTMITKTEI